MLINLYHETARGHRRLQFAGIIFLVSIALLIWMSVAIYNKKFTDSTTITVMADRAGLQLSRFADVRLYGARVGYVDEIGTDGKQAVITVALRPEAAREIPENVGVRILPTTLFGQKYLEIVPPERDLSTGSLRDGSVIPADRVNTNVELQTIFANLFPLLRSVRPADLNATLYALAHSLQGKGDQLGDTLVDLEDYLQRVNVELPTLREDLQLLSEVADNYELAAPDLLDLLKNATVTARTVTEKEDDLNQALASLTGLARTTRLTLSENEQQLKAQTRLGRPLLALLDTYSPELNCLLTGLERQIEDTKNVFQGGIIHQTLELGAPQRLAYTAEDAPVYGEVGHGPWCLGLPDNYKLPATFLPLKDGTDTDERDGGLG